MTRDRGRTHPRLRQPSRLGAAGVLAAVTLGTPFLALPAAAADTPTINCDTVSRSSSDWQKCTSLVGTAKCVWNNGNGTYTLAMGFQNPTDANLYAKIPVNGSRTINSFTATGGSAGNPGHLALFPPGTYTTAFTVTWSPTSSSDPVTWTLVDDVKAWNRRHTPCATKPVPVVGSAAGLALGALGVTALLGLASARRNRLVAALRRLPVVGRAGPRAS